jgi:uncharacterized repeat protein (TIGR01451 family)
MRRLYLLLTLILFSLKISAQCTVTVTNVTDATCGQNNGSITMEFSGGIPPYAVNLQGIITGSITGAPLTIPNLSPGNYFFSVTDGIGVICTGGMTNVVVGSWGTPIQLSYTTTNPTPPACTNGSITVNVSGGMPPYFYQWSNGSITHNQNGLSSGIYVLYVYDSSGCFAADTITLTCGGANIYSVSGVAYYDLDNDSALGANDIPLANQQIEKQPSGQIIYTDQNGNYIFGDTTGATITLSHLSTNGFSVSNGIPSHTTMVGTSNVSGFNFALGPDSMFHSVSASSYSPLPRCNNNGVFYTSITNQGTYTDSGSVTFNFDPAMVYFTSSPPGTVNGNSLTFSFSNLLPFETRTFISTFTLPGPGTILYTSTTASFVDGLGNILCVDTNPNAIVVRCAFDPNDKAVSPAGVGANNRVDMDTELRYLIRFQNTGNDTAFTVVVTDTIAPGLDINSLYVISTSHVCWIEKIGGELMRFHFDDILLPDSNANEPASHGYVYFRVKGNQNNLDPTVVTNTANIYFDLNPPIATNTTLTTFSNSTVGISDFDYSEIGSIQLSPHPMGENTLLLFDGDKNHSHLLELMDVSGRNVTAGKTFSGTSYLLQRESLTSGMYLIKITDEQSKAIYYTRMIVK